MHASTPKLSRSELIEAYTLSLIRWGTYSTIEIDAVTRDMESEVIITVDGEFKYQGGVQDFRLACAPFV